MRLYVSHDGQMSESMLIGCLLAVAGGFMDAYTYLIRGGVFANAQTGNLVLLGMKLAQKQWIAAFYNLLPILAFAAGVFLDEYIRSIWKWNPRFHWRQGVLILEFLILLLVCFLPNGYTDMLANVLVSFVCALQAQSFRKVDGLTYASTMCTGNLRSGTEQLAAYLKSKSRKMLRNALRYYGIIITFILGAMCGTFLVPAIGIHAILFCCAILGVAIVLLFIQDQGNSANAV